MIPRYSRPEIKDIWSDKNKFKIWLEIEVLACEAMAKFGYIPKEDAINIRKNSEKNLEKIINPDAIKEIEKRTRHDVIAFTENIAKYIGESSRFVHQGMTSSDLLDTAFAVQLKQTAKQLIKDIQKVRQALKTKAEEYKDTPKIGRTHGVHAEPTTYGLFFAGIYAEFSRNERRLMNALKEISTCAISGAIGTFANIDPRIEAYIAEKLGLEIEPISTQIIPRDRHAMFFSTLGVIASSIERFAIDIRLSQITEIGEMAEGFAKGQKGSSAMPHKKNPIACENLTGQARTIRGYVMPALENVALWFERDISHSSVERVIAADATGLLNYSLNRMHNVIDNLVINEDRALDNISYLNGMIYSQRVLLALTQKGISREDAYKIVQKNAMKIHEDHGENFSSLLKKDKEIVKHLNNNEIDKLFDIKYHTKHADTILSRVFKEYED